MTMTDQSSRQSPNVRPSGFAQIEAVIERARAGELTEEGAFAAISRIVRERAAGASAETYQKPWG